MCFFHIFKSYSSSKTHPLSIFKDLSTLFLSRAEINFMGVFSAYQEHRGILYSDFDKKANEIYEQTKNLLERAKDENKPPHDIYIETALEKAKQPNPIDGHRGIKIIEELIGKWDPEKDERFISNNAQQAKNARPNS